MTESAHPARFSPDDKFSSQRVALKKRFGIYVPDLPQKPLWEKIMESTDNLSAFSFENKMFIVAILVTTWNIPILPKFRIAELDEITAVAGAVGPQW